MVDMKVYISADMEGISGIVSEEETFVEDDETSDPFAIYSSDGKLVGNTSLETAQAITWFAGCSLSAGSIP